MFNVLYNYKFILVQITPKNTFFHSSIKILKLMFYIKQHLGKCTKIGSLYIQEVGKF